MCYFYSSIYEIQSFICWRTFYDVYWSPNMLNFILIYYYWSSYRIMHFLYWFLSLNRCWLLCLFPLSCKLTLDCNLLWIILNDHIIYFLVCLSIRHYAFIRTILYFLIFYDFASPSSYLCFLLFKRIKRSYWRRDEKLV